MTKPGRRKLCFSDSCPEFFKVYLMERSSQQLQIPAAFVKKLNGIIPSTSTIINDGRRTWRVEVNKVDDHLYFQNGWREFVQDNSLTSGEFLVFSYGGSSMFYVQIFGKSGCLEEVPIPTSESTHKQFTLNQEIEAFKPRKYAKSTLKPSGKQIAKRILPWRSRGLTTIQKNDGASRATRDFVTAYPSFQVVIKPSYVYYYLNIPYSFYKSYMEKDIKCGILQVSTKSWPVKVKKYRDNLTTLARGWALFAKDNTLKAGDVCIFELIERYDFVLKVSILRGC